MPDNDTLFAPAKRADANVIYKLNEQLANSQILTEVINSFPCILMIINRERQVVYNNKCLLDVLDTQETFVLGNRPGEIFNCINSHKYAGGCGTSENCRECGAVLAILQSQKSDEVVEKECYITTSEGESLEFKVSASPFSFKGIHYTIVNLVDISDAKRRFTLERTFSHDINNSLTALSGYSYLLSDLDKKQEIIPLIKSVSKSVEKLMNEIKSQQKILKAEEGTLDLEISGFTLKKILDDIETIYSNKEIWGEKHLQIQNETKNCTIISDKLLLYRVLSNMVKNAFEAAKRGEIIKLTAVKKENRILISVKNKLKISRNVQLQIFQRSFSTKGRGRGLGTYCMKLFGEKYLKGKVWFKSNEEKGTTFNIQIPARLSEDEKEDIKSPFLY